MAALLVATSIVWAALEAATSSEEPEMR